MLQQRTENNRVDTGKLGSEIPKRWVDSDRTEMTPPREPSTTRLPRGNAPEIRSELDKLDPDHGALQVTSLRVKDWQPIEAVAQIPNFWSSGNRSAPNYWTAGQPRSWTIYWPTDQLSRRAHWLTLFQSAWVLVIPEPITLPWAELLSSRRTAHWSGGNEDRGKWQLGPKDR